MKKTQFCCNCRTQHEISVMQQVPAKHGYRWRCKRSIQAAATSQAERDAFGQQQTEINRDFSREAALLSPRAVLRWIF